MGHGVAWSCSPFIVFPVEREASQPQSDIRRRPRRVIDDSDNGVASVGDTPMATPASPYPVPMPDKSHWTQIIEENPDHSAWYIQRFKDMAAEGRDLDGEARLVDAMAPRNGRILDAGCGPGRVGARLAKLGHDVVGIDVDPALIDAAAAEHPTPTWIVGDLAELDLAAHGITDGFDVIVAAGNVMTFLAPSTRRQVLTNLRRQLRAKGRVVVGFGAGRDYEFDEFFADADHAGLRLELCSSTWDLRPFGADASFLVAVLAAQDGLRPTPPLQP